MAREFTLPDVGEGVAEGELVRWLVDEGDAVTEDQPVAEVETDKAQVEVPAPVDGTVRTLHWDEGDVVPVGDVFVTFDVEGEPVEEETAAEAEAAAEAETTGDAEAAAGGEAAAETGSTRTFAPPSVRRLARELDVDLDTVEGTGPSGRVTEGDVRAAAEAEEADQAAESAVETTSEPAAEPAAESAAARPGGQEPAGRDRTLAAPATRGLARELGVDIDDVPAVEEREGEAFVTAEAVQEYAEGGVAAQAEAPAAGAPDREFVEGGETTEPYRGIRRTIGEQMAESKYTAPHVTHHDTAVIDDLVATRENLKERAAEQDVKLTYLPFVMKAVVAGLKEYPIVNSELREADDEIALKQDYNVGVAVATDHGLMVPVVKHVDQKSILQVAQEVNALAAKARDRSISREEMQGGTFTITNFGAVGGEYATPIINYPETAILGLGGIDERPVAEDGEVRAAKTLPLSLSIDHRVIDGAEAAEFTNYVMERLTDPELLLLE
jgi:pyruvate dehydrogenase E2 component (dihydrolipoamide acetyltransferase)